MKKIVVIVFAGLLVSAGLQAQKVYIKNNKVILDLTEGMPAGAITNVSKTAIYDNITVSNTVLTVITGHNNDTGGDINRTVFQKLEIAPHNVNAASGTMGAPSTYTTDWVTAFNACKNSTHNGDNDWRLPTQRELMMMCIFKEALDTAFLRLSPSGTGGTALSAVAYWSATEYTASYAWYVDLNLGTTNHSNDKTYTGVRVRCVREVTD
jgi:hypothetical protein